MDGFISFHNQSEQDKAEQTTAALPVRSATSIPSEFQQIRDPSTKAHFLSQAVQDLVETCISLPIFSLQFPLCLPSL